MIETRTPVDVGAYVRQRMGYPPINPFLEGPPLRDDGPFAEDTGLDVAPEQPSLSSSPLVPPSVTPLGPTLEQPEVGQAAPAGFRLAILDGQANVWGTQVELDDQRQAEIITICLRAKQEQIENQVASLAGARRVSNPAVTHEPAPTYVAPPKKRGRPRGSKNREKPVDAEPNP